MKSQVGIGMIKLLKHNSRFSRSFAQLNRSAYTLPKNVDIAYDPDLIVNEPKDFKKHVGLNNLKPPVQIGEYLENTINKIVSDHSVTSIKQEAAAFHQFMKNRRLPLESKDQKRIIGEVLEDIYVDDAEKMMLNPENRASLENYQDNEYRNKMRTKLYKWSPINYTKRVGLVYLVAYFAPQFAALKQIFQEIKRRDAEFAPKHVFDFGSGVGTAMWAADAVWQSSIKEYFNSDISVHMNELSNLILRGGQLANPPQLSNVFYRQSFPASPKYQYELVVSAFSLFEQSNARSRFEVLDILWKKVAPDGYLVLVDQNSVFGNSLILEARDYVLNKLCKNEKAEAKPEVVKPYGHVFSPCSHDFNCPLAADNQKCTFRVSYYPLKLYDKKMEEKSVMYPFSYVVLKKSQRNKDSKAWPRLVHRDSLNVGTHTHAWLCTKHGNVDHYISTKNRSRVMHKLIRYSNVGDQLPLDYPDSKTIRIENKELKLAGRKQAVLTQEEEEKEEIVNK